MSVTSSPGLFVPRLVVYCDGMVVEYIRYVIPAEQAAEFEDAYRRAGAILTADEHCLRHEISRGVENPDRYVVRIEWDSVEGTSKVSAGAQHSGSSSGS